MTTIGECKTALYFLKRIFGKQKSTSTTPYFPEQVILPAQQCCDANCNTWKWIREVFLCQVQLNKWILQAGQIRDDHPLLEQNTQNDIHETSHTALCKYCSLTWSVTSRLVRYHADPVQKKKMKTTWLHTVYALSTGNWKIKTPCESTTCKWPLL